ncbi:flavin-containing monooxygenase [Aspergillus ibericus CBS 121593]|uniref:FAD/NAD(P)-binding domain-containing protein n=1 Tax=Aspergillus ibericus CBS 121593 TaxID=1448316 RepID=A0A395GUX2_9EURO|nr:FAD/NAD(P)-binding domain-containing protein [Aspergillus ibericus CBS 121593]RAK99361.1 FAD/NAD(P)-binding domain-containing protein [Aspergillus ibericus CBS 121593]
MAAVKGPQIIQSDLVSLNDHEHHPTVSLKSLVNETVLADRTKEEARPAFEIEEHPIDQVRPIKVGVIGAGLAGITAGILFPAKVPGLDLRIYEKNAGVGGTWFENTYPGVRCDIPAHVYQSGFSPNTQWTEEFAQGHEIREYWQRLARKYDVHKYLRLQQQVEQAVWLPELGKWRVTLQDLGESKRRYEEDLDMVINAIGHFNAWQLPDYPGIDQFSGALFHSSNWNHDVDLNGKRIALIGNGASGLQVLPSIQPIAQYVDHYARNKTWIADSFGTSGVRRLEPNLFSPDQLESFRDPDAYLAYRKSVEAGYFSRFGAIFKDSPENNSLREKWTELMKSRVGDDADLADKLIPDFPPNCRRATPGPGYLEALTKPNVNYIQTPIQRFTPTGIITTDGIERPVDIIICSTGANVDHAPPFSIIANGIDLKSAWKHTGLYGFPYNYLGVATPNFPNLLWIGGPHSTGHGGSVPNSLENQITYISKLLRKLRSQGIKAMAPSPQAADDFVEYCDKFYPRTVWTANDDSTPGKKNCRSWYNGGRPGGKVHGLFPGSAASLNYLRRDPRWEDWDYTYVNPSGNRFAYFGNGWTTRETLPDADLTPHLKRPDTIDLRTYLEGWWDV